MTSSKKTRSTANSPTTVAKQAKKQVVAPNLKTSQSSKVGRSRKPKETASSKRKRAAFCRTGTFPFLKLSAELRNNIYERVLEGQPQALIPRRTKGRLASQSSLSRVNRQIRGEFQTMLLTNHCEIVARVKNFDFQDIVNFFNKITDAEMEILFPSTDVPVSRKLIIEMDFDKAWKDVTECCRRVDKYPPVTGSDLRDFRTHHLLNRWLTRFDDPDGLGSCFDTSYVVNQKSK